jgi:hypothetical protein
MDDERPQYECPTSGIAHRPAAQGVEEAHARHSGARRCGAWHGYQPRCYSPPQVRLRTALSLRSLLKSNSAQYREFLLYCLRTADSPARCQVAHASRIPKPDAGHRRPSLLDRSGVPGRLSFDARRDVRLACDDPAGSPWCHAGIQRLSSGCGSVGPSATTEVSGLSLRGRPAARQSRGAGGRAWASAPGLG